jgi:long-chain acyl-CoA synthetase
MEFEMSGNLYISNQHSSRCIERDNFELRARKLATAFYKQGIKENDTIAILMRNDPRYFEVIQACRYIGAYYVPLNWHSVFSDIEHIVYDAKAKILVAHSDLINAFNDNNFVDLPVRQFETPIEIQNAFSLSDTMCALKKDTVQNDLEELLSISSPIESECKPFRGMFAYTSGSTGRPKGIKRKIEDNEADKYTVYQALSASLMKLEAGSRFLVAAPLYHSAPNTLTICSLAANKVDIFIEVKFDAESFLRSIQNNKITHIYIVPTMMIRLLKLPIDVREQYDISSLQYALSTGSACPSDVKSAMIDWFGPIFYESYGASEIGFMTLISSAEAQRKPGSVGKVVAGGSIKILSESKEEMKVGESGLIYVDLPMFGEFSYTNADNTNDEIAFQSYISVGDIGYLDNEDYLFINDRKKDMIISGGVNIFPVEIESVLINMEQIVDCAIIGAPHPEFGEMVVAAVQCHPQQTVTLEQVKGFLEGKLAHYKFPRKIDLYSKLPREDSGKIFKQRLREPYKA